VTAQPPPLSASTRHWYVPAGRSSKSKVVAPTPMAETASRSRASPRSSSSSVESEMMRPCLSRCPRQAHSRNSLHRESSRNPARACLHDYANFSLKSFPYHPSHALSRGMGFLFLGCACALCEDFRHFLSVSGITGHGLCEEIPKKLFGGVGAPGIWQRRFRTSRYMGVLPPEYLRRRTIVFMPFKLKKRLRNH